MRTKAEYSARERKEEHPTPNIQHPTSNEEQRKRRFDLEERMLSHAARIVELYDSLPTGSGARQIGNQLIRSGTSPYLHHGEVEAAESLDDFVHKLKVCLKELRETWRALRLLQRTAKLPNSKEIDSLIEETQQLIRIFYQSVRTARQQNAATARVREDAADSDHWMLDVGCWMLDVQSDTREDSP
jgi:four helix bundle protein